MENKKLLRAAGAIALLLGLSGPVAAAPPDKPVERGRYLAVIAGCHDCHTPGYAMSGGKVPEQAWLTGDQLGWSGPWGTTYPANLRLYMHKLSEAEWLRAARSLQARPPMPSWALHAMRDEDLRALYRFIRSLGPGGEAAPPYLPPGQPAPGPVVRFPEAPSH